MIFQYGDLPVHYADEGKGAPILALHGWMGNADSFFPLRRDLAPDFRVIAPDFPGQGGQTPPPASPLDVSGHADIIRALIRHLSIEKVSIVAHSFGGRVSLKLAAESPELVHRMVLTGCAGLKSPPTLKRRARSAVYRAARGVIEAPIFSEDRRTRMREALVQRFGSADYKALSPAMRPLFNRIVAEDLGECLPMITAPTVLVYGTRDMETPIWMGERMAREMRDAALIPFEGLGHYAYLEEHGRFLAIVKNFLTED